MTANLGSVLELPGLNYAAYKPEQPTFATINQPSGGASIDYSKKETVAGVPVFNQSAANSEMGGVAVDTNLKVGNLK